MPYWTFAKAKQKPETLTQPFRCQCTCHPVLKQPLATHQDERRCDECYEDSGKPLMEVLESALAQRATLGAL